MFKDEHRLQDYSEVSVFKGGYREETKNDDKARVNIIGDIQLSEEEMLILGNNPKLAILGQVDQELVEQELEKSVVNQAE